MLKKTVLLLIILSFLMTTILGCGGGIAETDPDAHMIGEKVDIGNQAQISVMVVLEAGGSDYAKPDKGYLFNTVKFEFANLSDETIELREDEFLIQYGSDEYKPISGNLNFVLDKMQETENIAPGDSIVTKLVWMIPEKSALKVLVYNPAFATEEIRINLNEKG